MCAVVFVAVVKRDRDRGSLLGSTCHVRDPCEIDNVAVRAQPFEVLSEQFGCCGGERLVRVDRVVA